MGMAYDIILQAIAAKHGGEFAPDSLVFDMGSGDIVDYTLTIPDKWVAYLIEVSGYTTDYGINVVFYDNDNIPRWEWTEYIDTQKDWPVIPFLEKFYKGSIKFRFTNNNAGTVTVGWATTVLLIPEDERNAFEEDVRQLADLIPLLKKIAGEG